MGRRFRNPIEPMLERLVNGKVPKVIADELGVTQQNVLERLRTYVKQSGCRTLIQAVVQWKLKEPY